MMSTFATIVHVLSCETINEYRRVSLKHLELFFSLGLCDDILNECLDRKLHTKSTFTVFNSTDTVLFGLAVYNFGQLAKIYLRSSI